MNLCVENEIEKEYDFKTEELALTVIDEILRMEKVDLEVGVTLTLTGREEIREMNKEFRDIDSETDVLSFPNVDYENPSDFSLALENPMDYIDPDTDEIYLGDIVINVFRMEEQAENYGHSVKREFSFLIAHSMLHLLGYDHMTEEEEKIMFGKQEEALQNLGITR